MAVRPAGYAEDWASSIPTAAQTRQYTLANQAARAQGFSNASSQQGYNTTQDRLRVMQGRLSDPYSGQDTSGIQSEIEARQRQLANWGQPPSGSRSAGGGMMGGPVPQQPQYGGAQHMMARGQQQYPQGGMMAGQQQQAYPQQQQYPQGMSSVNTGYGQGQGMMQPQMMAQQQYPQQQQTMGTQQTAYQGQPVPIGNDIPRTAAPTSTPENAQGVALGSGVVGLTGARDMTEDLRNRYMSGQIQYPGFQSSQQYSPSQVSYMTYTPTAPLTQIQAPNYQLAGPQNAPNYQNSAGGPAAYQGLMGGDYNRLQGALQMPGQIAASRAYEQSNNNMVNQMTGNGMYGSTMMGGAQADLARNFGDTMATNAANAAAQRYGLQATDLGNMNQYNQGTYGQLLGREQGQNQMASTGFGQQLGREDSMNKFGLGRAELGQNQALNTWKAGTTEADRMQNYNQGQMNWNQSYLDKTTNWQNQQLAEQNNYALARQAYDDRVREQINNQYLALAGQGAPLTSASQAYMLAQQQMANANQQAGLSRDAASSNALWGAAGTGAGGLMGSNGFWNQAGKAGSSVWDWATSPSSSSGGSFDPLSNIGEW